MTQITHIPLHDLHPHPLNSNVMPEPLLEKLTAHIARTGQYPPLIVRALQSPGAPLSPRSRSRNRARNRLPHDLDYENENEQQYLHFRRYQLLDGHHRLLVLRRLNHQTAACLVWDVDDAQALVLLTTLNRLQGRDDPLRRAEIVRRLPPAVRADLPETPEQLRLLSELHRELPPPVRPLPLEKMPIAVHFFLTGEQRQKVEEKLASIGGRREEALMRLIDTRSQESGDRRQETRQESGGRRQEAGVKGRRPAAP